MGNEELLKLMTKEDQESIIKKIVEKQAKLELENAKLKDQVEKQTRVIHILATEGIDVRDVAPIEEIAPILGLKPEEMKVLLEKNPAEYLKQIHRKFNTIMSEQMRLLEDMGVTLNGDKLGDMFSEADEFWSIVPTVNEYTPEQVKQYPAQVLKTRTAIRLFFDFMPVIHNVLSLHTAQSDLTMRYSAQEIIKQGEKRKEETEKVVEQRIVTDYEAENAKIEEEKQEEIAKPNPIETLVGMVKAQGMMLSELKEKIVEKTSSIVEEPVEEDVSEKKKKK